MMLPSLLLAVLALLPAQAPVEDALPPADAAITRAELEHHVRFLAGDELGGRAPLTSGMERAARYLAKALAAAGVQPAGEEGGYFQTTGLRRYEYPSVPRLLFTDEAGATVEARYGVDFSVRVRGTARSTEKLPLRFFYDYNHSRMPLEGVPGEALYFQAGRADKRRILAEKGIENLDDWGLEFEVLGGERGGQPGTARESMGARTGTADEPEACELIELRGELRGPFELRKFTHAQLLIEEVRAPFDDYNVVGRIPGAGTSEHPELAQEVVLFSAHYDHLGVRPAPRGVEREDMLFNGADDDASGCAALLELAQAFALGPQPVRTLVFLFTTGEESGGVGSRRYLAAPPEPIARTVANLNLEMLGRPDELAGGPGRLWLTGFELSNLGAGWQQQGLAIVADPRPDQKFFRRSDNFAFALEGVVAQTLSSFNLHAEYHTPRDEPDTLDFAHLEAATRVAWSAAQGLADGSLRPAWLEGRQPKRVEAPARTEPKSEEEREAERERRREERRRLEERAGKGGAQDGEEPK